MYGINLNFITKKQTYQPTYFGGATSLRFK